MIHLRFLIALPARGRSIEGQWANDLITVAVPQVIKDSCYWGNINRNLIYQHTECVEDQEFLRAVLPDKKLIAFVADGSVLPRLSGQVYIYIYIYIYMHIYIYIFYACAFREPGQSSPHRA